jgi:hypothetical protein
MKSSTCLLSHENARCNDGTEILPILKMFSKCVADAVTGLIATINSSFGSKTLIYTTLSTIVLALKVLWLY